MFRSTKITDIRFETHERVVQVINEKVDLYGYIAVHNTRRGPALGGIRYKEYSYQGEALEDVLRLAESMSMKNSLAALPYGGGKAVIHPTSSNIKKTGEERRRMYCALGDAIEQLGGVYIAAEDVGTTREDLFACCETTQYCSGTHSDSGEATAKGMYYALQSLLSNDEKFHQSPVHNFCVCISGLGKVGGAFCKLLTENNSYTIYAADPYVDMDVWRSTFKPVRNGVTLCDEDLPVRVGSLHAHKIPCDIYSPCAFGPCITAENRQELNCNAILGSANNQIDSWETVRFLHGRGIVYVPDYLVNAGGVIALAAELTHTMSTLDDQLHMIGDRVKEILRHSLHLQLPPAYIAHSIALRGLST